jgi:hypothetical protein
MTVAEENKRTDELDFETCREKYRDAVGRLMMSVNEHWPDETKNLYESLTPTSDIVGAISNGLKAKKRKARTDELAKRMPREGDEALVDVCPCGDETWMLIGTVLLAWHDDERVEDAVWAVIEITRPLTHTENRGWQTDASWNGCKFVCRLSYRGDDWRALWPANDRARDEWQCTDE